MGDIGRGATVPDRFDCGVDCVVEPYAYVSDGCSLGNRVRIGARATLVPAPASEGGAPGSLRIGDDAVIGPAAVVSGASIIGAGARVEAGAVVTTDVPRFAIVAGNPAQVVGYVTPPAARGGAVPVEVVHAPVAVGAHTLSGGASIIRFPEIADLRGRLTFAEVEGLLPFEVKRFFLVYDIPSAEIRGEHAHRRLHQLLIAVSGQVSVLTDDGSVRQEVVLDSPTVGVHLPPMIWGVQFRHSTNAVLLVLASEQYLADDYIREYDEFADLVARRRDGSSPA